MHRERVADSGLLVLEGDKCVDRVRIGIG